MGSYGDFKISGGEWHILDPGAAEGLKCGVTFIFKVVSVEIVYKIGTHGDLALTDKAADIFQSFLLLNKTLVEKEIALCCCVNLGTHVIDAFQKGVVSCLRLDNGDLVYTEAEVFIPKTVYEEVDVPGVIIAVAVVMILDRGDHAFFFIIAYEIC